MSFRHWRGGGGSGGNVNIVAINGTPVTAADWTQYFKDLDAIINSWNISSVPIRDLSPVTDGVYVDLQKVSGTVQTAADWSLYFKNLNPYSAINTLDDFTSGNPPMQLPNNPCSEVILVALDSNTGTGAATLRIGDVNISASRGMPLDPGTPITLKVTNTNLIYVFGNGTDKVSVMFV